MIKASRAAKVRLSKVPRVDCDERANEIYTSDKKFVNDVEAARKEAVAEVQRLIDFLKEHEVFDQGRPIVPNVRVLVDDRRRPKGAPLPGPWKSA